MGLRPVAGGSVRLAGRDITADAPRERIRAGVGYVPEDRQADGLVAGFSVADNMVLDVYDRRRTPRASRSTWRRRSATRTERVDAVRRADHLGRHARRARCPAATSRRSILAREFGRDAAGAAGQPADPRPGRRLDRVRAPADHRRARQGRGGGHHLGRAGRDATRSADRIAVMYEGRITGFRPPTVPVEELGMLMAGAVPGAPAADDAVPGESAPSARRPTDPGAAAPTGRRRKTSQHERRASGPAAGRAACPRAEAASRRPRIRRRDRQRTPAGPGRQPGRRARGWSPRPRLRR